MPPKKQIKDDQTIKDVLKAHKEVYLQLCKQHLCSPIILKAFEESNRQMQLITKVNFTNCTLADNEFGAVVGSFHKFTFLETIDITSVPFTNRMLGNIAKLSTIATLSANLTQVVLMNCNIDSGKSRYIREFVRGSRGLTYLNMNYNPLGSDGVNYVLQGALENDMKDGMPLTLCLECCHAGTECAAMINMVFQENVNIELTTFTLNDCRDITLAGNMIGDGGLLEILDGLAKTKSLRRINFGYNCVYGEKAVVGLAKVLEGNDSIDNFGFEGNHTTTIGYESLLAMQQVRAMAKQGIVVTVSERAPKMVVKKMYDLNVKASKKKGKKGKSKK